MAKFVYYVNNTYNGKFYIRPHFHRNYEIVFNVFGNSITKYDNSISDVVRELGPTLFVSDIPNRKLTKTELRKHSFIIYPPFYTHDEYHENEGKVIAINFQLDNDEGRLPIIYSLDSDEEINELIEKIAKEMSEKKANYLKAIDAYLTLIVAYVSRKYMLHEGNDDFIDQIVKQVDDYYATKIDFDSLADSYGYNSDYLRALFKKKTGLSPKGYIQKKRLDLAIRQIKETDLPLKIIAINCGYDDYLQFTSFFKKKLGVSPADYRKKNN